MQAGNLLGFSGEPSEKNKNLFKIFFIKPVFYRFVDSIFKLYFFLNCPNFNFVTKLHAYSYRCRFIFHGFLIAT